MLPVELLMLGLQVIKLSLELTIKVIETVPPEQHAKNWERHERIVSTVEKFFGLVPS